MMTRPPKLFVVGACTLPLLLATVLWADDWPQWRGANRDGVWSETGILESFPADGLKVRWRAPVGWGFSSPVVAQGRVFLADSEVVKPTAKERVHCWDETTGKPLWTHSYDVAYEDWAFDPAQEIGPVATPIILNGKAYTLGRLSDLCCLDVRTGDVLWQKNLRQEYQVAFSPGMPSPLIEGELLILFIGGKPGACIVALHKDTGQEVWKALDESLTFSSPIVIASGGERQLIVWTQESVTSLDPMAGTTYWRQRLLTSSDYSVSTPVFYQDRLLIGGLMFQLDSSKPAASVLWPASKAPSRRIYSHTSTALFRGDYLFSAKSSGELICVDASTGEQVWETDQVTDLKSGASIHLTPNGDSVLLYTNKGELIRARLTAQGYEEISRVAVLEPTFPFGGRNVAWSPPAYANHHIFVRNGKELVCASLATTSRAGSFAGAKPGDEREIAGIKCCWCPPGRFTMGSPPGEPERRPGEDQVAVTLTKGFWMAKYEATQGQWKRVVGKLPGPLTAELPEGDDFPVGNVNFAETEAFCRKLTELGQQSGDLPNDWEFRLPTEAQWEYACRAGTTTATAFGDTLSSTQANFKGKPYNGAEPGPSLGRAAKVGSYPANAWGLHDMHGNTFEWCRDWYHARLPGGVDPDLYSARTTAALNRDGSVSRVRRGGAWTDDGWPCRSAFRVRFEPERRYDHIGFRVVAVPR